MTPQQQREAAAADAFAQRAIGRNIDYVDREIESARSEAIAEMAQSRRGRIVEYDPRRDSRNPQYQR